MTLEGHRIAVAIPARNEAALIGRCLRSLATQEQAGPFAVVVVANDCSDETVATARSIEALDLTVIEHSFPVHERNAGHARRLAMALAARHHDIVLTTDADCVADADWVAAHRHAFAAGVDAVAGRVSADWEELRHHPARALAIGALEWDYLGLIGEAESVFDPQPHDPAPRHAQCCGANIGITSEMLAQVGGVPAIGAGEDRALLEAVARYDGRIRYDRAPHVIASPRTAGRAVGGMADALAARIADDYRCDDQLVAADILVARWRARRDARARWQGGAGDTGGAAAGRSGPTFGAAWETMQATNPLLAASPLRPSELPMQIERLRQLMANHG